MSNVANTAISEAIQGIICLNRINLSPEPIHLEKRIKFLSVYFITLVLIILAYQAHLIKTLAIITFLISTPNKATIASIII